ncbi:MAG: LTA synthase family protein [Clostridia bacterium]|nr:LTA synthase family protein [Clostridia bacterium]
MKKQHPKALRRKKVIGTVVCGIVWLAASVLAVLALWYDNTFDMSFAELLYTIMAPLGGTGESTVSNIISSCLPTVIVLGASYLLFVIALWADTRACRILRRAGALFCALALVASSAYAAHAFRIVEYIRLSNGETLIYDEHYVDPDEVEIVDRDGEARNLIYIYLESMETTYASVADGGEQAENNYMPNLTSLADEHVSFSEDEGLGGFHSVMGTGWTMGALMASTSGVPFSLSVFGEQSHNSLGDDGNFVNGLTALGDVLEEKGYAQEFLCGSDISFAGRDAYFEQHGNYELFDYYTAIEEGYIAQDYKVWWGYEDKILYEIAKDELTELAAGDKPFNFTMLTVDAHHVGGYKCTRCGEAYDTKLKNVISCADAQVAEFLAWCMEQEFYENTTIVITGDHPRMDTQLVKETDFYDRTVYNCFINAEGNTPTPDENGRVFTTMDLFPTVLAAMGYEIEGERLGLGTNLFSTVPTLAEAYGYDWLEEELSKYSLYYKTQFVY